MIQEEYYFKFSDHQSVSDYVNELFRAGIRTLGVFRNGRSNTCSVLPQNSDDKEFMFNTALKSYGYKLERIFFDASDFNDDLSYWQLKDNVNISDVFDGSQISDENYSKTLVGWANRVSTDTGKNCCLTMRTHVYDNYTYGSETFNQASVSKEYLGTTGGWTIVDGTNDGVTFDSTKFWIAHNNDDVIHYGILSSTNSIVTGQPVFEHFDTYLDMELKLNQLGVVPIRNDFGLSLTRYVSDNDADLGDAGYDYLSVKYKRDSSLYTDDLDDKLFDT
tara:strand:+ start:747 stop:1574 length:828 start_codon:yes stop_codon:yes gene_type:complete